MTGQTATGGSVRGRPRALSSGSRTGWAPIVVLAAACAAWLLLAVGPAAGQTILYFQAPWGLQLEAITYPNGMAYEKDAETILWSPRDPQK